MTMPPPWSDLPDDLLRVVYTKVVGPLQRIRFAAVCRSWRAGVITLLHAAPSVVPWLILSHAHEEDKRGMYCPKDNQVFFPVSLPIQAVGKRFVGGHDGGWVAVLGDNMALAVVNLFSGIEVLLPVKDMWSVCPGSRTEIIPKVVFSESPASSGCILAAITSHGVALCRIGCPNGEWTEKHLRCGIVDILFFNGQLYCLTIFEDLFKLEIGVNKHHEPVVTAEPRLLSIPPHSNPFPAQPNNILELNGKLVMVVRTAWPPLDEYFPEREPFFRVFELADESTAECTYKWKEVTSLGDYAIFLGKMWSKAVYLSAVGHNELPRSCIYTTDDLVDSRRLQDHGYCLYPTSVYVKWGIRTYVLAHAPGGMWVLPPDF
ncbi:uncharacterized protein [Aegilops tauschii subsp. strangulata]|uniref:KIB1-4 beta-propeller domain-containing protein n=1 Tax=Aegilops tauschii TaxID=37682 RepID=M8BKL5_AEGTA|nr:uncharacterized protein LOC109775897 [Aegilops tauschii subsp. strangulata]